MKANRTRVAWVLGLAGVLLCLAGAHASEPIRVAVSIPPQQYLVERIGGDRVVVDVLLPPGMAPETFQITPQQVMRLSDADLYCCIGISFEQQCMVRIAGQDLPVLHLSEGLPMIEGPMHHHHGHDHAAHGTADPHVWTSPVLLLTMTAKIADTLIAMDASHAETYRTNADQLAHDLRQLDDQLRQRFAALTQRSFLVLHPAWSYLAREYDLQQIPIEQDGKSPGPRRLAELIQLAQEKEIRTVFSDPQFSMNDAEMIARELHGTVVCLDPLAADLMGNLERVGAALADSMQ